jgi:N-acetylated-alpha-linked acidic dipeptidase
MADVAPAADERTPLIAVVRVAPPPRPRYPHSRVRGFCTFCLATLLTLAITASLLTLFFVPSCEHMRRRHRHTGMCVPRHPFFRPRAGDGDKLYAALLADDGGRVDLFGILARTPNESMAREWSRYYTAGPHLAGKNLSQAEWTRDRWAEFGVPVTQIASYDVYLNYPVDHRLALLEKKKKAWNVKFEASLKEDVLPEDGTSGLENQVPTFHGYSASGNVTAPYVYVNYGTYQDFEDLLAAKVSLKGNIAIAKYGGIFRGLKVKRAQELGMVGMVIYSDPGDDGDFTEENGSKLYPAGPGRNPSSVQRGSVQFLCELILSSLTLLIF